MSKNCAMENGKPEQMARGLGWLSIGLGIAGVVAPRGVARLIGVKDHPVLFQLLGLREIASGIGILTSRQPAGWLWTRVGGDAMDLALMGAAFTSENSNRPRLATATVAVASVTAMDMVCSEQLSRSSPGKFHAIHVEKSITVNRSKEDIYAFWHAFEQLPDFMNHLTSVKQTGDNRWHWIAKGPAGTKVEWDAEIINDKPNELIAWRSLEGADVDNAGTVRFERAPGGRGTKVTIKMDYNPPGGVIGAKIALLFGEAPEKQLEVDLHRFKQLMETGEIATTEGQSAGRARSTSRKYDDFVRH